MALILGPEAVRRLLPMKQCIEHTAKALALVQAPELLNPVRHGVVLPLADKEGVHILGFMPCYLASSISGSGDWKKPGPLDAAADKQGRGGYICSKIITVFPSNVGTRFSGHQGVVLLYSAENGSLLSITDAHEITGARTAAASAVATRMLAPNRPCDMAILGSGYQAVMHVEAIAEVRELTSIRMWSRTRSRADDFAASARAKGINVQVFETAEEAVRGADIVCTLTPATSPILKYSWLKPGAHVNAVGSCHPLQQELDDDCVGKGIVFCDSKEACLQGLTRTGDLVGPIERSVITADSITELGPLLENGWSRAREEDITVFKSVGIALEDLCSVVWLYEQARIEPQGAVPRM